jgi:hypothetical protein
MVERRSGDLGGVRLDARCWMMDEFNEGEINPDLNTDRLLLLEANASHSLQ